MDGSATCLRCNVTSALGSNFCCYDCECLLRPQPQCPATAMTLPKGYKGPLVKACAKEGGKEDREKPTPMAKKKPIDGRERSRSRDPFVRVPPKVALKSSKPAGDGKLKVALKSSKPAETPSAAASSSNNAAAVDLVDALEAQVACATRVAEMPAAPPSPSAAAAAGTIHIELTEEEEVGLSRIQGSLKAGREN